MPYLGALLKSGASDAQIMSALEAGMSELPEHPGLQSVQIMLLVSSSNPQARNPQEAHKLAQQLAGKRLLPQHQELLALTHAATGDFEKAVEIQQQQVSYAVWYMPTEVERLTRVLSAYQAGTLPAREDLLNWSLFQPAVAPGAGPFSHYPTPKPY